MPIHMPEPPSQDDGFVYPGIPGGKPPDDAPTYGSNHPNFPETVKDLFRGKNPYRQKP